MLTAEKLAQDGVEIDDDEEDDDDEEEEEEEDGGGVHVLGSSFAAAEDFEHLRDIDENEDDIDEDDEEVRPRCCCAARTVITTLDCRSNR